MLNAIIFSLLLGIIIANVITVPESLSPGISFSSKYFLEIAIIFLGFGIRFQDISSIGWQSIVILIISIIIVLISTLVLSKFFSCKATTGYLVGFGTAICGTSAIAALAPKITDNKKDVGIAIAVINLLGLLGMLVYPFVLKITMNSEYSSLLIGGTLHGVSNVAGAAYAIDESIGDLALTIKLGRVALLAPALLFFNFILNRKTTGGTGMKLPYYLVGFFIVSALVTFIDFPPELISWLRWFGKALLVISMAAIGLNIHFTQLYREGRVALLFGFIIFIILILSVAGLGYLFIAF